MFSHPEPIFCPTTLPPHSSWDPSPSMHKQHPILSVWSLYLTQKLKFFPRTLELALYISHSTFDCQSPHRTSLIGGLADNLLLDFNCTIWMVLLVLLWTTLQSPFQKKYLLSLHSLDSFSRETKLGIRSNLLSLILLARYLFFFSFPFCFLHFLSVLFRNSSRACDDWYSFRSISPQRHPTGWLSNGCPYQGTYSEVGLLSLVSPSSRILPRIHADGGDLLFQSFDESTGLVKVQVCYTPSSHFIDDWCL